WRSTASLLRNSKYPPVSLLHPHQIGSLEIERDWPWLILRAGRARAPTFRLHSFKLDACLLAISKRVVGAKGDLLAAWEQEFLTALHQILLVERPGIHEVLQHNHQHVVG